MQIPINALIGIRHDRKVHLRERDVSLTAYLRAAHAYMLISMPTGTSTIFGVFQAISALLLKRDERRPREINYCRTKSSPAKSFSRATLCCGAKEFTKLCAATSNQG